MQVAAIQLMIGDRPYVALNSPPLEDKTEAATALATSDLEALEAAVLGLESETSEDPSGASLGDAVALDTTADEAVPAEPAPAFDIWFRNNHTKKYPHPRTEVEDGVVKIYGLSPGSYYMKVEIDAEPSNGENRTGDLASSSEFEVVLGEVTQSTAPLLCTLRLTAPWDSNDDFPETSLDCETAMLMPDPPRFGWQPPAGVDPGGIEYVYKIVRRHCDPPADLELMVEDSTVDTSVEISLPPTRRGEVYEWTLYARRSEHAIGQMMTFYEGGAYGGSLEFRVE